MNEKEQRMAKRNPSDLTVRNAAGYNKKLQALTKRVRRLELAVLGLAKGKR